MAGQIQATAPPNMDQFEAYFRRADLDQDGRISGAEAVAFFQGSNLPTQVLAQIWMHVDRNRTGFLGRAEFYNALKLVTVAQSKRELTPAMVNAALYGPASAKIPPPQINFSALQAAQPNLRSSTLNSAVQTTQSVGTRGSQGFLPQQSRIMSPTSASSPRTLFDSQQGVKNQVIPVTGILAASPSVSVSPDSLGGGSIGISPASHLLSALAPSQPPGSNISSGLLGGGSLGDQPTGVTSQGPGLFTVSQPLGSNTSTELLGGRMDGASAGASFVPNQVISPSSSQDAVGLASLETSKERTSHATSGLIQPTMLKTNDSALVSNLKETFDSKATAVSGNGIVSSSLSGNAFANHSSFSLTSSTSSSNNLSTVVSVSAGHQPTTKMNVPITSKNLPTQQPVGSQYQQLNSTMKQNQQDLPPPTSEAFKSSAFPVGGAISWASQSQLSWPKMTPSDIQKYRKVFLQVDTDHDGKITGKQARDLFLSWRLPREVLKQVWDLSDQDNDSMLSLREFCIALYLMERHREGCPLPTTLPGGILLDEMVLPASNPSSASYANANWRPTGGFQQAQGLPAVRPVYPAARGKPPRPVPVPEPGETMQPKTQKPKAPVLEKHLVDQLSTEEQNLLRSKFREATDAEKKVEELEKEILDSRQKIEFYRAKMQELVLYKSRCDNRLNEITERISADKREAESLAKKYEEKYQQFGDVASKLTIEEATFRDIQDEKMELYRSIVKLEQEGSDSIQVRADKIQSKLEELVKTLNERCKIYGLRAKPTSLMELPFGWQHGIQEGAADWDEVWDKFEDEGFTFVKELTLDVQNVSASPRPKPSLVFEKTSPLNEVATAASTAIADGKSDILHNKDKMPDEALTKTKYEDDIRSSPVSPAGQDIPESPSQTFHDSHSRKNMVRDGSPHSAETRSELGAEPVLSGDKGFDEPSWGAFDTQFDADVGWDANSFSSKDMGRDSLSFDSNNWGLNPIRTGPAHSDSRFQKGFVFDSVPSTPLFDSGRTPHADNIFQRKGPFGFADSVPSTPLADTIFQKKSAFPFADSVPSTPHGDSMYANSPIRFSDLSDEQDAFSRFDSFSMHDAGSFPPSLSRFDSMRSTRDTNSEHGFFESHDSFARFDSMHTGTDSEFDQGEFQPRESFSRVDSMSSTRDSDNDHGFVQSHDPFSRFDTMRSTRDSEHDHGLFQPRESLSRFDSFRSTSDYDQGPFPPGESLARFDSIRSTRDSNYGHGFSSFDDSDPFGPSDPFKISLESQTPRKDADNWKAF